MNYWLVIVRERTFMDIIEKGLFGCRDPDCGLLMTRVRPGTRLVVFVSGFGCKTYCKSFVGVLEVVGDWVKAGKVGDWSHVVEVRPIALGRVELGAVAGRLSFIRGRRGITEALHSVDPANPKAMPMPPEDAELIMSELRRQSTPRPAIEALPQVTGEAVPTATKAVTEARGAGPTDAIGLLVEVAQLLGYYPVRDVEVGGYRLGLAWWGDEDEYRDGLAPLAVFEVVEGPEQALARLKHAKDRWRGVRLYAVVTDEGARRSLEAALRGSFHELRRRVKVLMLSELQGLVQGLRRYGDLVREFATLGRD